VLYDDAARSLFVMRNRHFEPRQDQAENSDNVRQSRYSDFTPHDIPQFFLAGWAKTIGCQSAI
jgi:hypothetical protein